MPQKICIVCGQDCSTRPRTKDEQGRYTCRACFDSRQAARPVAAAAAVPAAVATAAEPLEFEPALAGGLAEPEADQGVLSLILDDAVKAAGKASVSPCPGCGHPLQANAALCVHCGYSPRTGRAVSTRQGKAEEAPKPIPVTGKGKAKGREADRQAAAHEMRMTYLKPIIMMLVGVGVTVIALSTLTYPEQRIIGYLISFAIIVPLSVGAYMLCCLLWMGFDFSIKLVIVRLAGIYALMDMLLVAMPTLLTGGQITRFGGFGILGIMVSLCLYAVLLAVTMELDIEDALIAAVVTGLVKVIGTVVIFSLVWAALSGM